MGSNTRDAGMSPQSGEEKAGRDSSSAVDSSLLIACNAARFLN